MRAVIQRCIGAAVTVSGRRVGGFEGPGLVALVGVTESDGDDEAERLAGKIWYLRIFDTARHGSAACPPPGGPSEVSAADLGLPVLVISQFTLYGRTDKGRRPTWEDAAPRDHAEPLVDAVAGKLRELGATVATGSFGADMQVSLTNDGPVTLLLEV